MLDEATIERLKMRQKQHWQALSLARSTRSTFEVFDDGIKHHEIGLDSKWYIAGYAIIKAALPRRSWKHRYRCGQSRR